MQFLISDTFTESLARLTGEAQKAAKTTAFDLQMDPTQPGLSFHRLDRSRDKHFWSVRVNADIRLIVHGTASSLMLCYVDHHDRAYEWAERRKLETHPTTGAAQLVEVRETVKEVVVPVYVDRELEAPPKPPLFSDRPERELLGYGVPPEWIDEVRRVDEDALLVLADRLPAEAAEALLELATGGTPRAAATTAEDPFGHPDAQRRFRVLTNVEELERALAFPWEKWTVFLHPDQRQWVEHAFNGPARVSGSAGTGKTIVALHRAVHLARANPDARILLTTFSETLAHALRTKLRRLAGNEPRLLEHVEVHSMDALGLRLHNALRGPTRLATRDEVRALLKEAASIADGLRVSVRFVETEWDQVVDAWQLSTWEAYRDVQRMGRKSRLPQSHRETLWGVFESVRQGLESRGLVTQAGMFTALGDILKGDDGHPPYDFAVVDEAQDLGVAQLRFLAALAGAKPNGLFFAGDLGQRIFQAPFSWMSLGVDIRGRSRTLRVNYRTSHQIRMQADRLLGPEVVDMDGNREDRRGTVSVFNGPLPMVRLFGDEAAEVEAVASWLAERAKEEGQSHALAVFVRSEAQLGRARAAAEGAGLAFRILDERVETAAVRYRAAPSLRGVYSRPRSPARHGGGAGVGVSRGSAGLEGVVLTSLIAPESAPAGSRSRGAACEEPAHRTEGRPRRVPARPPAAPAAAPAIGGSHGSPGVSPLPRDDQCFRPGGAQCCRGAPRDAHREP